MAHTTGWGGGGQGPSGLVVADVADVVTEPEGASALSADPTTRELLLALLVEVRALRDLLELALG